LGLLVSRIGNLGVEVFHPDEESSAGMPRPPPRHQRGISSARRFGINPRTVLGDGCSLQLIEQRQFEPVGQEALSFELADSAKTGVPFEKTPIRLKLSLRRGDERASETQIDGEVGQWDVCRDKAVDWLGRQLAAQSGGNTATAARDDLQRAKQLAEEELATVAQWTGLSYHQQQELNLASRRRIARHVLRAAHLDPTSEPAAYLTACYVDTLYPREGKDGSELSLVAIDRAMVETQRYLDRFPQKNVEHHLAMFHRAGAPHRLR
jgi:hypothetical protein